VKFLEKELLVLSQGKEEKYPVELMDWEDGDSLGACQLKVEDMSTVATKAELNEAITDEFGVKYSKDGRKLLKVPQKLKGTYSIKEGKRLFVTGHLKTVNLCVALLFLIVLLALGKVHFPFVLL
jgi:hypothetical protein